MTFSSLVKTHDILCHGKDIVGLASAALMVAVEQSLLSRD